MDTETEDRESKLREQAGVVWSWLRLALIAYGAMLAVGLMLHFHNPFGFAALLTTAGALIVGYPVVAVYAWHDTAQGNATYGEFWFFVLVGGPVFLGVAALCTALACFTAAG